jgi:chromosome partitioning protein
MTCDVHHCFGHPEGGSGKSTRAIGLALAAIEAGHTVGLIETDLNRRVFAEPIVEPLYTAAETAPRLAALNRAGVAISISSTLRGGTAAVTDARRRWSRPACWRSR